MKHIFFQYQTGMGELEQLLQTLRENDYEPVLISADKTYPDWINHIIEKTSPIGTKRKILVFDAIHRANDEMIGYIIMLIELKKIQIIVCSNYEGSDSYRSDKYKALQSRCFKVNSQKLALKILEYNKLEQK